jgi:hypothetical protein
MFSEAMRPVVVEDLTRYFDRNDPEPDVSWLPVRTNWMVFRRSFASCLAFPALSASRASPRPERTRVPRLAA